MLTSGQELKLRYEVKTQLGEGGMGTVYQAYDRMEESLCAIKEYRPVSSSQDDDRETGPSPKQAQQEKIQQERILSEAQILAKLKHPNLPRVRDYFPDNGCVYLVMDLVDGEDLDHKFRSSSMPNAYQVIDWSVQVLSALVYCHKQEVIHLDIKPSNIIVTDKGIVYLVDFGIAQYIGESPNAVSIIQGTKGFSPPEQYQGKPVKQSDIYALGATMYFLLTGKDMIDAQQRKENDSLETILPAKLDIVVKKAIAIDPSHRYQTAVEMGQALLDIHNQLPWTRIEGLEPTRSAPGKSSFILNPSTMRAMIDKLMLPWKLGEFSITNDRTPGSKPIRMSVDFSNYVYVAWDSGDLQIYSYLVDGGEFALCVTYSPDTAYPFGQVEVLDIATIQSSVHVRCYVLARIVNNGIADLYEIDDTFTISRSTKNQALPRNPCCMTCDGEALCFVTESGNIVPTPDKSHPEIDGCSQPNGISVSSHQWLVTGLRLGSSVDAQEQKGDGGESQSDKGLPQYALWNRPRKVDWSAWQPLPGIVSGNPICVAQDPKYERVCVLITSNDNSMILLMDARTARVLARFTVKKSHFTAIAISLDRVFLLNTKSIKWCGRQRLAHQFG